jgi:hypothetical protein
MSAQGVTLSVIPFGASQAPFFDGVLGSFLTIDVDPQYSQSYANALTVAAWICPLALNNAQTAGTADQYVHFVEKAVGPSIDVEWALRFYNQTNPARHSRSAWARPLARETAPSMIRSTLPSSPALLGQVEILQGFSSAKWRPAANGLSFSNKRSPSYLASRFSSKLVESFSLMRQSRLLNLWASHSA